MSQKAYLKSRFTTRGPRHRCMASKPLPVRKATSLWNGNAMGWKSVKKFWEICRPAAEGEETAAASESDARRELFSTIVPIYDQVNDVMSLGQHWEWKRRCVQYSGARLGSHVLDVCCGSGDLTYLLAQRVGPDGRVVGLDFSQEMLKLAETKQQKAPEKMAPIEWIEGDAQDLPFAEATFDAVTIGYGLRNVTDIPRTLQEIHRVLRPGAKMSVLDFNASSNPFVDTFQDVVLNRVVVPAAGFMGMEDEYKYLRASILRFPKGPELEALAIEAGFSQARHLEIANGLMGILVAQRSRGSQSFVF